MAPEVPWIVLAASACAGGISYVLYRLLHGTFAHVPKLSLRSSAQSRDKKRSETDYTKIFPPSQREVLKELLPDALVSRATAELSSASKLLGLESDYISADPTLNIFSGFTVGEVKALGRFPDYAKLSGVPLPSPAVNFDIETALPRPYRPFRWNYHQTMAYQKMDHDYWLELENTYRERVLQRQELYSQHGAHVLQALPGAELACKELMEMAVQFLCARYPREFLLKGDVLHNNILGTQTDLSTEDPLRVLLDHVPEDFALMLRDEATGRHVFRAGVICSALGWSIGTKIGMDVSDIHEPVPHFEDKLTFSVDRFFTKMKTSSPIQRGSWGLEMGQPLYLPADHPDLSHRESQSPELSENDVHLRVDWQTLRRLPLSGAIVFNYKALFTPLKEFRDEAYVPSLILKVLNEGDGEILKYKGTWHVEHVAKPALQEYERWQVEKGLIEQGWEPRTLDETPFFPGWEAKWRRGMGLE